MKAWQKDLEIWPRALPEFDIEPNKAALLLVDVQNYLADSEYGFGPLLKDKFPDMFKYYYSRVNEMVLPNVKRLLDFFRDNNLRRIFLTVGPELSDGSDFIIRSRMKDIQMQRTSGYKTMFPKGSIEHSIIGSLKPQNGELVINKTSLSPFNSTGIDHILRRLGIEYLIMAGMATNVCIETTARDAADRGYACIIVDDACASFDQESHDATLRSFSRILGMVEDTKEVLKEIKKNFCKI